jgi:hypothetical protein
VRRVLCDSGFYLAAFIEYLEKRGLSYIIAVPVTAPIQRRIARLREWSRIEEGLEAGEFRFEHADEKWTRPRRYAVIRQHVETRPQAPGKHGRQMMRFEEYEELGRYRYNLLHFLDTRVLNRNRSPQQARTIRQTWFILPGQLGNSGGSYRLRIAVKAGKVRARLNRILHEIQRLPCRLNCNAVEPP